MTPAHLPDIKQLTTAFLDDNKLLKEQLRVYVAHIFLLVHKELDIYVENPTNNLKWHQVNDLCVAEGNHVKQAGVTRIRQMHTTVDFWLRESVSSLERLEFFILCKAAELSTGDTDRDYYHALLIRHDQLLSASIVFQEALEHIKLCCQLQPLQILDSPDFLYFVENDIEARVFDTAEQFYQTRVELGTNQLR